MGKDQELTLLKPICYSDGTPAEEFPFYPDMVKFFAHYLIGKITADRKSPNGGEKDVELRH